LSAPGNLTFKWPGPFGLIKSDLVYSILDTDYINYMAAYMCSDLGLGNMETIRILTRSPKPTTTAVDAAKKAFSDNGVSTSGLVDISTKCF
jgi:hypothetical protein